MLKAFQLGLLYFAAVFALAFLLGVGRTLYLAPAVGPTAAVLMETPVVLGLSIFIAAHLLKGPRLGLGQLALMGAVALGLTLVSEAGLAGLLRGQSLDQWAASLITPLGLLGLSGQVAFALVPLAIGRRPIASPIAPG